MVENGQNKTKKKELLEIVFFHSVKLVPNTTRKMSSEKWLGIGFKNR